MNVPQLPSFLLPLKVEAKLILLITPMGHTPTIPSILLHELLHLHEMRRWETWWRTVARASRIVERSPLDQVEVSHVVVVAVAEVVVVEESTILGVVVAEVGRMIVNHWAMVLVANITVE
jgi:hypothetical protein